MSTRKVVAIVTDNATNFSKAFVTYGLKDVSLADNETMSLDDSDSLVAFQEIDLDSIDQINSSFVLPPQKRCASHTLSLVATTDVKKYAQFTDNMTKLMRYFF